MLERIVSSIEQKREMYELLSRGELIIKSEGGYCCVANYAGLRNDNWTESLKETIQLRKENPWTYNTVESFYNAFWWFSKPAVSAKIFKYLSNRVKESKEQDKIHKP